MVLKGGFLKASHSEGSGIQMRDGVLGGLLPGPELARRDGQVSPSKASGILPWFREGSEPQDSGGGQNRLGEWPGVNGGNRCCGVHGSLFMTGFQPEIL